MNRMVITVVAILFALGIALETTVEAVKNAGNAGEIPTADRYIAAQRDEVAIQADTTAELPRGQGAMKLSDCGAEKLNPHADSPMTATVMQVVDGDTLRISVEGFEIPVRLWGIDAPEMTQKEGVGALRQLEKLTPEGSRAQIHPVSQDRYGRMVAVVSNGTGYAVNFEMVARGWAYHYRQYDPRPAGCLAEAERVARDSRMGVWQGGAGGGERPWQHRWKKKTGA